MPVISFVSPKGGVGKTTATILLAAEIADSGGTVRIVDADPNSPIVDWAALPGKPDTITVVQCRSENEIGDVIDMAEKEADFVLVDLEGAATAAVTFAISYSDLVLIPCKGSHLDAAQAARAIQLVRNAGKATRRVIDFAILFTQIPPALRSLNFSDIENQFSDADIPVLPVAIYNREAYRTIFSTGGTLQNLSVRGAGNMKAAQENASAYAAAVIARLKNQAVKEDAK
jgi:chromosome partitioning protein